MRPPCELVQKEYLPNLRANLATKLHDSGQSQSEIARWLNITQAAVSKYLNQDVKRNPLQKHVDILGERLKEMILSDSPRQDMMVKEICRTCMFLRIGSTICTMHRDAVSPLGHVNCDICTDLLSGKEEEFTDRGQVLRDMQEALDQLSKESRFALLIPQVRSNLVACGTDVESYLDVAGVPGRITLIDGHAAAPSAPRFGASQHTANLLLWAKENWPSIRSCLAISGSDAIVDIAKDHGFKVIHLSKPATEPEVISELAQEAIVSFKRRLNFVAIHVPGGIGVEPILYLFGPSAVSLSTAAIALSEKL